MSQPLHDHPQALQLKFWLLCDVFKWPEDDHVMVATCSHTLIQYNKTSRVGDN